MSHPLGRIRAFLALLTPLLLLIACNSTSEASTEVKTTFVVLPFASATALPDEPSAQVVSTATTVPEFTPTPIVYVIVEGNTLLGIAERNGMSLDDLLLANPGVDARFLSVGQEIFIPNGSNSPVEPVVESNYTELSEGETSCFASAVGELWCFFLVENKEEEAVENAAAQISLVAETGEVISQKEAFALIQKMDQGVRMPLVAFWDMAPEAWVEASGQVSSAFRLDDPNARYLQLTLDGLTTTISDSGKVALVSGDLKGEGLATASSVWVLAVAYTEDGGVTGTRRLVLEPGEIEFSFEVYSLGPDIASVDVLVEGQP